MIIILQSYVRVIVRAIIMIGCGLTLNTQADVIANGVQVASTTANESGGVGFYASTNATFSVLDTFQWQALINANGTYSYYDLERNIFSGKVYHTMRVAGTAVNTPFVGLDSPPNNIFADAECQSTVEISEDMLIEYVPNSITDTPPTSISFQESYTLAGQVAYGADGASVTATPGGIFLIFMNTNETSVSISTNILGSTVTQALNTVFQTDNFLHAYNAWANNGGYYSQPASYDLRYLFQGFVNIVDQSNQPIPPSKLIFWCVNPGDTTQRVPFASATDLANETTVSLQAIPGTNSLTLQWPSYATNYQLETTTNLANGSWGTNSLPPPVVSGPFLQVTVPTTNAAAFFRLQQ